MAGKAIYKTSGTPARIKGEAWLFVGCEVPAVGENMTLALDPTNYFKTPDATENASALCVGCTKEGWTVGGSVSVTKEYCDESPAAISTSIDQEEATISGVLMEPLDPAVLVKLQGMIRTTTSSTSELLEFGGLTSRPNLCVALCFRRPDDPSLYGYYMLYSADVSSLFNLDKLTRKSSGGMEVTFNGLAVSGRAAGKQYGQLYIEL
ncbi:hypothetical protein [Bacteriophage sp.]|nr:hypothetical protein [Bacteriophage sp.]